MKPPAATLNTTGGWWSTLTSTPQRRYNRTRRAKHGPPAKVLPMTKQTASAVLPLSSGKPLKLLTTAFRLCAEVLPSRITLRQCLFISMVAYGHATNQRVSLRTIKTALGDSIGRSIEKSYFIFREPTKRAPDGMGWIEQVADPDDMRQAYLRLTPVGVAALTPLLDTIAGL